MRRANADSEAVTYHYEERMGFGSPMAKTIRAYRNARIALKASKATEDDRKVIESIEEPIRSGPEPVMDIPLAARAGFLFFEGNETFTWTFVSPPAIYRPGPRTGKYEGLPNYARACVCALRLIVFLRAQNAQWRAPEPCMRAGSPVRIEQGPRCRASPIACPWLSRRGALTLISV